MLHNVLALAVLTLGFIHSISIDTDVKAWAPRTLWGGYLAAALATYLYHRFVCPRRQQNRPYNSSNPPNTAIAL